MRAVLLILISVCFGPKLSMGQTSAKIDSLLNRLCETDDSKTLSSTDEAKLIVGYGKKALPVLSGFFTDTTLATTKSACHNFTLSKGEVAIIVADRIEMMPFMRITGIQNCLLEFCEGNPNLIEYYMDSIRNMGIPAFKSRYDEWLKSKDRKKIK